MAAKLPPPPVNQPFLDPETHYLTPQWKRWFVDLHKIVNDNQTAAEEAKAAAP